MGRSVAENSAQQQRHLLSEARLVWEWEKAAQTVKLVLQSLTSTEQIFIVYAIFSLSSQY